MYSDTAEIKLRYIQCSITFWKLKPLFYIRLEKKEKNVACFREKIICIPTITIICINMTSGERIDDINMLHRHKSLDGKDRIVIQGVWEGLMYWKGK